MDESIAVFKGKTIRRTIHNNEDPELAAKRMRALW